MKVRISNIQRFCLNDGPGIRTVVFLKGCNLKCPWCANPENMEYEFTHYIDKYLHEKKTIGYDIEAIELFNELIKDEIYFKPNNGGITFSGGEPLLQIKALEPLLKKLKENKINIAIETSLQVNTQLVERALNYIDEFIIDIKILNKELNNKILKGNLDSYIKNIELLHKNNKINILRIPLSYEYTLTKDNQKLIISFLKKYNCHKVEIFKVHNLAKSKYQKIGKKFIKIKEINDNDLNLFYNKIKELGININKKRRVKSKYKFINRKKDYDKLCIILAGYKEFLYDDIFNRIKKYIPKDIDVCITSSGLYSKKLDTIAKKNNWSYLSTKKNKVTLAQNITMMFFLQSEQFNTHHCSGQSIQALLFFLFSMPYIVKIL